MDIFDSSMTILEKSLDVRAAQQRIVAANLANVDTPGYTAQKLDFETSLANALKETPGPLVVQSSTAPSVALDGNNVNLEEELGDMTRNRIMYSVTAQVMAAKMRQLSTAIGTGE